MNSLRNTKTNDAAANGRAKLLTVQRIAAIIICAAVLGVFIYCYIKYGKELYRLFSDPEQMRAFLEQFNGFDKLAFVAVRAFQTVIKVIPAEPLEIGSGVLYGTWGGLLLCFLGTEIGSLVIILLTKIFGKRLVELFVPIEKINSLKFLQNKRTVYRSLFIIYLIPGTPKDVLTYAAGLTDIDMKKFMLITGIARLPSIISSTWCGDQITGRNFDLAIIIFAVTAALSLICSLFYKKFTGGKSEKSDGGEGGKDNEIGQNASSDGEAR